MTYGGSKLRTLAACGLTAAALLVYGAPAHAQIRSGSGGSGMSSGGFGGGGGQGGGSSLGSSNGFGNSGNGQFSFSGGTSFVGSSSQSFAGGSGSGSFSGGSSGSSFTGGSGSGFMGSSGSSYGGGGLGGGFRGGSVSNGVSTMNPFRSSYGNALASGLGMNSALGQALYSNLNPSSTGQLGGMSSGLGGVGGAGMRGGMGGAGGMGSTAGQTGGSLGALGVVASRSLPAGPVPGGPAIAAVGPVVNPVVRLSPLPARMQADLTGLVSRSEVSPATRGAVTFGLDATGTVVLRGTANAAEAQTIESLIRFAPGVRAVRNEINVR